MAEQDLNKTQLMISAPGIARDGTKLARRTYNDAVWCRWYQKLPRKMRGYREQVRNVGGLVRAIDIFSYSAFSYVHVATGNGIFRYAINNGSGVNTALISRVPVGFVADPGFNWQFTQMYNVADTTTSIFAAGVKNLSAITADEYPIYYGDIIGTAPLIAIPGITTSGGVCAVGPFLFVYGHDGIVQWSNVGNPLDFASGSAGDARPTANSIVRGMPLRGQSGPAIIMWSLDSVIIGTWVGGTDVFDFTTVTTTGSVLSANGFVEHNGVYYWATTTGFSMFNGVVRDIPNEENKQWFFDNLNFSQRQKVFAFKIPRWNEIWWCFPKGDAQECNHAVILNTKDNFWYDTPLPNGGRSAGTSEFIFNYPIMAGVAPNQDTGGGYSMWQHEAGLNEVSGNPSTAKAIRSYYLTSEFNFVAPAQPGQPGTDKAMSFSILEPDFDQRGPLFFNAISRANARAREISMPAGPLIIDEVPAANNEQLVKFKFTGRLTAFSLESNALDGNYITGAPLIHFQPGDGRRED